MMQDIPEGFVPLVIIGESEGQLLIITSETHEETGLLLEDAFYILQEQEDIESFTKH
jgi:PHD/YefM family antitoxin component YafN of YafNO toxin-antitoxin module